MKELGKRVLVAIIGGPLILGSSFLGSYYFLFFILIINGLALWEFYTIYRNKGVYAYRVLGVALASFLVLASYPLPLEIFPALYFIVIAGIIFRHLKITEPDASTNTVYTLAGISYITIFLISLLKLRQEFSAWSGLESHLFAGGWFLLVMWASIWICDTLAYFGGRLLGKHKLAPHTSPNKTIEGAAFGLLGGVLSFLFIGHWLLPDLPYVYLWISGFIVGILGQTGDLVESRFKRDAGVKDTSAMIPGHGGFFDRFDSVIFVSPFFFLLFYFFRP